MASHPIPQQTKTQLVPLGQAIRALPAQYLKVVTRPSVVSFAEEQGKATWGSIWFQLIALGVVSAALSVLAYLIAPPPLGSVPDVSPSALRILVLILLAGFIAIATPLSFMIAGAVLYWLAKLFKGDGSYLRQVYTLTLFGVPVVLLSSVLMLLPATSSWLPYLPHLYGLMLLVVSHRVVHHLSTWRALVVLLIPLGIVLVLALVGVMLLVTLGQQA